MDRTAPPTPSGHVIVCGFGGLALRIIDQFIATGEQVVLLVKAVDPAIDAAVARWQIPVHTALVSVADALREASLDTAMAVVCVDDTEVWNLEAALVAGQLRSDVRVITELTNPTVAGAMSTQPSDQTRNCTVLDVADLASPSVVEACLGIRSHHVPVGGVDFVTAEVTVDQPGTLRTRFGDLAPLAVTTGSTATGGMIRPPTTTICPGRDHPVLLGDTVSLVGTPAQFAAAGVILDRQSPTQRSARPNPLTRARYAVRAFVSDANPNFFRMLGVLLLLLITSTAILRLFYQKPGMSVLDAVYFSTETVATVGYGDFNFADQPPALRIWSIVLMFTGLTTTAMIMAFLAELLISRRIAEAAGRRKARFMTGHVVVIGLGAFGIRVAREIAARGHEVLIIERSPTNRFLSTAAQFDLPVVLGDATVAETLLDARVQHAAAVAVLTSDDMANVETAIAVRAIAGKRWDAAPGAPSTPVVLRVFNRAMADAVSRRFDFRHVRSTAELAAPWFIGAALGLEVLSTFSVQNRSFMVGRLQIAPDGGLVGVRMQELSANTRVIAIRRVATDELEYPPRRETAFAAGDDAYVVGPYEELLAVLEHQRSVVRLTGD
ncbi:NAD-binding protein [Williamsia sp. CHRR-6]|uniref:NAD-binding protein n=1 Tax=Williamsia sp. CHRR-6 TaxID=2835871 RepID=UPI001BDA024D|nr:NAD-binding protein [Williamsia sp. CHRR-6]MBT0567244.1 NAD-binding protein [Williamsia sp. CHRR-6]